MVNGQLSSKGYIRKKKSMAYDWFSFENYHIMIKYYLNIVKGDEK